MKAEGTVGAPTCFSYSYLFIFSCNKTSVLSLVQYVYFLSILLIRHMDYHLKGHPYVKSPVDMACWDILGKVSGLPVSALLGGREQEAVTLYRKEDGIHQYIKSTPEAGSSHADGRGSTPGAGQIYPPLSTHVTDVLDPGVHKMMMSLQWQLRHLARKFANVWVEHN
jgi:hypothetical protein